MGSDELESCGQQMYGEARDKGDCSVGSNGPDIGAAIRQRSLCFPAGRPSGTRHAGRNSN